MLKYKQIWHRINPTRWLIKFNLTREKRLEKETSTEERKKEINKKMITSCYSALSKMKAHCSKISNFLAYASFDGVGFLGFRC